MCRIRLLSVFHSLLLAFAPLVNGSCGECVFEVEVSAQVVDADGDPLADVEVTTCVGERCAVQEGDDSCISTITDADGRFTLEIQQCRPEPFKCELRPLLLEVEGCAQTSTQVDMVSETDQVLTYVCES